MDDIAREMGISKKTLYQVVDNKEDLIRQVVEQHSEEERAAMANIKSRATDAIDEILGMAKYVTALLRDLSPTTVYDLQKYYRKIWDQMQELHQKDVYDLIKSNLVWGIEQGLYRKELDPDIIAKLYVGKTMLVVDEELFPVKKYDVKVLFEQYINYHIQGIASDKGRKLLEKHLVAEAHRA